MDEIKEIEEVYNILKSIEILRNVMINNFFNEKVLVLLSKIKELEVEVKRLNDVVEGLMNLNGELSLERMRLEEGIEKHRQENLSMRRKMKEEHNFPIQGLNPMPFDEELYKLVEKK